MWHIDGIGKMREWEDFATLTRAAADQKAGIQREQLQHALNASLSSESQYTNKTPPSALLAFCCFSEDAWACHTF